MADTKKYVSEFEVQSNIDEALKQLQKYYVEFAKMPNVVDNFSKALKKSTDMEKNFYDMMSAIPKMMKRLSRLSKIELMPRKELEKISDAVQLVSSASKNLEGKTIFDVGEVKSIVGEFENVVLELNELEAKHSKIIEKSEAYNKIISETTKIQKNLNVNAEKFKHSTKEVYNSYTGIKSQVSKVANEMKKVKEEGKITNDFILEYDDTLKKIRKKMSSLSGEQENAVRRIEDVSNEIKGMLEGSTKFVNSLSAATGKVSFGNAVEELQQMSKEIEAVKEAGKYNNDVVDQFAKRTDEIHNKMGKAKEIFSTIDTILGNSNEVVKDMSNSVAQTSYDKTVNEVKVLRDELQKVLKSQQSSYDVEKKKSDLIKAQEDAEKKKEKLDRLEKSEMKKKEKIEKSRLKRDKIEIKYKKEELKVVKKIKNAETESEIKQPEPIETKVDQPKIEPEVSQLKPIETKVEPIETDVEEKRVKLQKEYQEAQNKAFEKQKELDDAVKKQTGFQTNYNDAVDDVRKKLDSSLERLNLIAAANEQLNSKTKLTSEAMGLVRRMLGEINEEMQDTSKNDEITRLFTESAGKVKIMGDEIIRMLGNEKISNEEVRKKIGLLKNEGDRLRVIVGHQEEIKKLEEQSISATVKRAREQDKINTAYAKQILSQRKNLGGLVDAVNVYKKNIPTKAIATFGETGVAAGKAIGAAFKALSGIFAPLAGLMGLTSIIMKVFELEKQVKATRKQVFMMAADSNLVDDSISQIGRGGLVAASSIEKMSSSLDSFDLIKLGINFEQATSAASEFVKQGFKAGDVIKDLASGANGMFAQAASLGMEIGELASRAGSLRAEFGYSLSETSEAFETLRKDARNAGINVSIFFDKVMNASVGLALWGQKIDVVSGVYSKLFKAMKLPESVGTELAQNMVKSFSDMSTEMQIVTYQQGEGASQWKKFIAGQQASIEETDKQIKQKDALIQSAKAAGKTDEVAKLTAERTSLINEKAAKMREKRSNDDLSSLKSYSGEMARARKLDVGRQIMIQLQAAGKKFGVDFQANIEDVDTGMKNSMYEMEKIGEVFGIDRKTMQGYQDITSSLKQNVKAFRDASITAKLGETGLGDIQKILGKTGEVTAKKQEQLVKMFPSLEQEIKKASKSGTFDYDKFKSLLSKDTDGLVDVLGGAQRVQNSIKGILGKTGAVTPKKLEELNKMFPGLEEEIKEASKSGKFDYDRFGALFETLVADPAEKANLVQQQLKKLVKGDDKKALSVYLEQLGQQGILTDVQKKMLEEAKNQTPEKAAQILKDIATGIDLSAKIAKDAGVKAAKARGAAMLEQTKSTQEAIENAIGDILRTGFRWLEKLANMFSIAFSGKLTGFQEFNDSLQQNKKVVEKNIAVLKAKEGKIDVEITALEKDNPEDPRIEQLKNIKLDIGHAISDNERLSESYSKTMEEFADSGGNFNKEIEEKLKLQKQEAENTEKATQVAKQSLETLSQSGEYGKAVAGSTEGIKTEQLKSAEVEDTRGKNAVKGAITAVKGPLGVIGLLGIAIGAIDGFLKGKKELKQSTVTGKEGNAQHGASGSFGSRDEKKTSKVTARTADVKLDKAVINSEKIDSQKVATIQNSTSKIQNAEITVENQKATQDQISKAIDDSPQMKKDYEKMMQSPQQQQMFGDIEFSTDEQEMQNRIREGLKRAGFEGYSKGGVVPGHSLKGDKVLAALNSGELVVPEASWKKAVTPNVGQKSLQSLLESMNIDSGTATTNVGPTDKKTINDNRVINISVNQSDRKQIEQIVLNAIYTDKLK